MSGRRGYARRRGKARVQDDSQGDQPKEDQARGEGMRSRERYHPVVYGEEKGQKIDTINYQPRSGELQSVIELVLVVKRFFSGPQGGHKIPNIVDRAR